MVIREYSKVELVFSSSESEAVKIALVNLRRDLIRTLDCSVTAGGVIRIIVGTVGNLPELDEKADISKLQAENATDFGLIMAGASLAAVPIIVVFLIFQKYFTKGITMGAVKG